MQNTNIIMDYTINRSINIPEADEYIENIMKCHYWTNIKLD